MVKEVNSSAEFNKIISGSGLTVVDYFAHWCGPCRNIAPFIEELSRKYPMVTFLKVDVDQSEISQMRGIRSMPTFQFFVAGRQVDELIGANPSVLEDKVRQHKVETNPFAAGKGYSLTGGSSGGSGSSNSSTNSSAPVDFREARLKAMKQTQRTPTSAPPPSSKSINAAVMDLQDDDDDEALAQSIALSMKEVSHVATNTSASNTPVKSNAVEDEMLEEEEEEDEEMVPVPVNPELLNQLVELGFPDVRARKALVHGSTVEGAIGWLEEHENDPEIDQPYLVRKSDTVPKPVLTEEEKAKKLEEMKEKIRLRKEQKILLEKEAEIKRERERRESGQKLGQVQEERDRMMRKLEMDKQKREKMEIQKERERLRAEIARDKEIRRLNQGVLPSVLGVEGYNPSAIRYDNDDANASSSSASGPPPPAPSGSGPAPPVPISSTTAATTTKSRPAAAKPSSSSSVPELPPEQLIDNAIRAISKHRTAWVGGNALQLLHVFVKNIAEHPDEPKYQTINAESAAFKSKLSGVIGPMPLLKALGFRLIEEGEAAGKLKLEGSIHVELFQQTASKLLAALDQYRRENPQV